MNDTTKPLPTRTTRRRTEVVRAWQASGVVLALLAIGWTTFSAFGLVAYDRFAAHHEYLEAITIVDVDSTSGSTTIVGDGGDRVRVSSIGTRGITAPTDDQQVEGTALHLRSRCNGITSWCSLRYTVHVPAGVAITVRTSGGATIAGVRAAVAVDAHDGHVRVQDVTGPVSVKTRNGGVQASTIHGDLSVGTTNGGITAQAVDGEHVALRTINGGVRAELTSPPRSVAASTSNGSIIVQVPRGPEAYAVRASTANGSEQTEVRTDSTSDRTIVATTRNGSITTRYAG